MMEVGFGSYAMGWAAGPQPAGAARADANAVLARAKALGYRRVQLADNVSLHHFSEDALLALAARARQDGVALEAGGRGLTDENLHRHLAVATSLGSWMLRFVIDGPGYEPTHAEALALLRRAVSRLREARVVLAIENHDRFGAVELADLVAACDSPWVGICFDTANSYGAGDDTLSALRSLAPHTVNVHLKDVSIRRVPSQQGFLIDGTPLGEGSLPIEEVISTLSRSERCRTATLEHWVPPEPDFACTLIKEEAWCVRSTALLRSWFPNSFVSHTP